MMNTYLAIGRLGRDAQLKITRNGDPMAQFSVAVDRPRRKGEDSDPDWIPCILFGDRARLLAPYLTKGSLVGISGRLESYKNSDGNSRLQVNVAELNFLSRPAREEEPIDDTNGVTEEQSA